jgi:non-ribosomal peptide synthetase component F
MGIALLAVWKSGGAYIPLDPAYIQERLTFMVADTGMKVLLTDEKCRNLFPSAYEKAVCVDSDWPVIAQEDGGNPVAAAMPSNLKCKSPICHWVETHDHSDPFSSWRVAPAGDW